MNVYMIFPYQEKYLRMCESLEKINYCEINILGDFEKINKIIKDKKIKLNSKITDIKTEDTLINYMNLKKTKKSILVFGDIDEFYQKQIIKKDKIDQSVNHIYVLDIPKLKHFIFVNTTYTNRNYDMTEKRRSMTSLYRYMNLLGITKANVALITSDTRKMETIEYSLIKMILKEKLNNSISFLNPCRISDLFDIYSKYNIFTSNINVMMFKNADVTKLFIELLQLFTTYRIGVICELNDTYYIDAKKIKDEENIIFTILLISKCLSYKDDYVKTSNQ